MGTRYLCFAFLLMSITNLQAEPREHLLRKQACLAGRISYMPAVKYTVTICCISNNSKVVDYAYKCMEMRVFKALIFAVTVFTGAQKYLAPGRPSG